MADARVLRQPARTWSLARIELRAGVRGGLFRTALAAAVALGMPVGAIPGIGVGSSAYAAGEAAWTYLGMAAAVWMAMAAVRDSALRTDTLVFSKPQPGERLVLARFAAQFGQILLILAAFFAGAVLGRLVTGDGLSGFSAYGIQYLRAAAVLFFASSASYCLSLLSRSPVAGALVVLYWIVTMAGKPFLAKVYFPSYTQNLPGYLFVSVALLALAMLYFRRQRRGGALAPMWLSLLPPVAMLCGASWFWALVRDGHDPNGRSQPFLDRITEQNVEINKRVPGFLFLDQNGRDTSLSQFPGRIFVIALWSPAEPESVLVLARLNALHRAYGARGVQPVAICLSEDFGAAATFARGQGADYPIVTDPGTHHATRPSELSPLSNAYQCEMLPKVVITDRRRRARRMLMGIDTYDGPTLETAIQERLGEEPE